MYMKDQILSGLSNWKICPNMSLYSMQFLQVCCLMTKTPDKGDQVSTTISLWVIYSTCCKNRD